MVRPSASDATQPETNTRRPARTTLVKWLMGSGIPGTRISSRRPIPCMAHLVSMYDRSHSERRGAIERSSALSCPVPGVDVTVYHDARGPEDKRSATGRSGRQTWVRSGSSDIVEKNPGREQT